MSDPYINEITGLEIPEHDRVASDFGRPTRDKRVSEVYCLFQNRGEKLRGRDHSAWPCGELGGGIGAHDDRFTELLTSKRSRVLTYPAGAVQQLTDGQEC